MVREQLETRDITDERVLSVMGEVPRERFVPPASVSKAYDDCALTVAGGQTISQPYIVALMTQAIELTDKHRVLEVGTGTGYQCMVLARLARRAHTVERVAALSNEARDRLTQLGVDNVTFRVGDGSVGWLEQAPFDRMIVTAAAPSVPAVLLDQLVDGGRLVIPVGGADRQTLVVVERCHDRTIEQTLAPCRFVRLIGEAGWGGTDAPEP